MTLAQLSQRFENLFDPEELDRRLLWTPFDVDGRTGNDIVRLFDTRDREPDGAAAAIVRYRPGAHVPRHVHGGYEIILVLDGVLVNDTGAHRRGTLEVDSPVAFRKYSPRPNFRRSRRSHRVLGSGISRFTVAD